MTKSIKVSLLTASRDRPYALGIAEALSAKSVQIDFVAGDSLVSQDLDSDPNVEFFNLRNQDPSAGFTAKVFRIVIYYFRLVGYAFGSKPKLFHILWNNKIEFLDRTALMLLYKALGKKVLFTAHNVNAGKRDGNDSLLNRLTLACQYRLCDHVFVHTERMQRELSDEFNVPQGKSSVIPFGINSTVPDTSLSKPEARKILGLPSQSKTMLFFGNIAPYKGLSYLVDSFTSLANSDPDLRLIIAGREKGEREYWESINRTIESSGLSERIIRKIEYVPDEETEIYFKAADVLVLPYTHIFQSGVLFLSYNFGLPVIASDVGAMKDDILIGETGFVCSPEDPDDLASKIVNFFTSEIHRDQDHSRKLIKEFANEKYSWEKVSEITTRVYISLLEGEKNGLPISPIDECKT